MLVTEKFTMRISPEDRENFAELKRLFKRSSQSDAIRYVVRETVKAFHQEIAESEDKPNKGRKSKTTK